MGLHSNHDENTYFSDFEHINEKEELSHKRRIRKMIEDRLEKNRLKEACRDEFDEQSLEDELDWDEDKR